jgi:hypothetical protein
VLISPTNKQTKNITLWMIAIIIFFQTQTLNLESDKQARSTLTNNDGSGKDGNNGRAKHSFHGTLHWTVPQYVFIDAVNLFLAQVRHFFEQDESTWSHTALHRCAAEIGSRLW